MINDFNLICRVVFLTPEQGGRMTSPSNWGYRGQFFYNGIDCDAVHCFDVFDSNFLGKEVDDYIMIMNPVHIGRIKQGDDILIREGNRTVAYGKVSELL